MGEEFVRDAQTIRIDGNVVSEEMGNLITSVGRRSSKSH